MPTIPLFPERTDRLIGWARLIVALGALAAELLDPPGAGAAAAAIYLVLLGYLAAALAALLLIRRRGTPARLALVLHAGDLAVFAALTWLTDGPISPFFLLFIFSVLAATLKWRWQGALWTSAAALGLLLATGAAFLVLHPADFDGDRFVVRCVLLVALGLMLVYFGRHQQRMFEELARLIAWPVAPPGSAAADGLPLRAVLTYVANVFAAPRALVLWSDAEEPWVYVTEWHEGRCAEERFPPHAFEPPVAEPFADRLFLCDAAGRDSLFLDGDGAVRRTELAIVHPALRERYRIGAAVSVPLRGDSVNGRLFVLDRPQLGPEDLALAAVLQARIESAIEHAAALDLWRRAAAAEDRLRVARDLHDGILQVLAGTTLQLQNLAAGLPGGQSERITALQRWLVQEQRELRAFIRRLDSGAPQDAGGSNDLEDDLVTLAERLRQQWGIGVEVAVRPAGARLPARLRFDLYQLVRESAANAARHGKASRLRIAAECAADRLRLEIDDDGKGFPFAGDRSGEECLSSGVGPRSLAARVKTLSGSLMAGSGGAGARLTIELPLDVQPARRAA
jgi:signal transduction histidine kinase